MTDAEISNSPPDWAAESADLLCPLCGYNLRGLVEGRCPECGFAFKWQELREAETTKHRYLFEHGRGHNFKTFWKTYWTTCRPRKFWRELNPAQPIHLFRLIIYWLITISLVGAIFLESEVFDGIQFAQSNARSRTMMSTMIATPARSPFFPRAQQNLRYFAPVIPTQAQINAMYPTPFQWAFWEQLLFYRSRSTFYFYIRRPTIFAGPVFCIVFMWPWITLLSLLVFRMSMRKAKIKNVQLLRAVVYSCDFGILLATLFLAVLLADVRLAPARFFMLCVIFCSCVTTYRLRAASQKYLRLHLPMATVVASQIIALLIIIVAFFQIADFTQGI